MNNQNNVKENLLQLVRSFPKLTENYNLLLSNYWFFYDGATSITDIGSATPAETITRNLRKLVAEGLVALPERVAMARKEKEVEFRHEFKAVV